MNLTQKNHIIIEASNRQDRDSRLEKGVNALLTRAYELGDRGVLVTRLSPTKYLIELDRIVPFGTTLERCRWSGHGKKGA